MTKFRKFQRSEDEVILFCEEQSPAGKLERISIVAKTQHTESLKGPCIRISVNP